MSEFQSTPARGRRPGPVQVRGVDSAVSIHACAGQATPIHVPRPLPSAVSIHACAGQATALVGHDADGRAFSIHACAGQATFYLAGCMADQVVSIHACAGQATLFLLFVATGRLSFNPRLRGAGDGRDRIGIQTPSCFNPRLRGAGDTIHTGARCTWRGFNPRLRGTGDHCFSLENALSISFQSTPARGRRRDVHSAAYLALKVSIHACAGQATRVRRCRREVVPGFNPRLRGAGDKHAEFTGMIVAVSIHACAGQATAHRAGGVGSVRCFNPRLRGAGDRSIRRVKAVSLFQSTPARGRRRGGLA